MTRWAGYVGVAIVFAIACGFLSNWQFTRSAERNAQLELVADNYDAEPVPLADLIPVDGEVDAGDIWHPVIVTGEYLADRQVLVRNRPHGGTSAFEVLVPLRTDDGRVFIVNRGWVPPGDDQPEPDEIPAPPTGEVTVVARLQAGEPAPRSGRSAPDGQVPTINLPMVADAIGEPDATVTSAYGLLVSEDPAPATRPAAPDSPSEDPGPHLSYAIQWILFAIMGFAFIWYMIRTELRHRKEDAAERTAAASTPRRRDRDMEAEDALLDSAGR
nr:MULTISPECIES: SURF1 family protein [Microbacterium]